MSLHIDVSPEFYLYRYRQGMCLIPPEKVAKITLSTGTISTGFTVADIVKLPFNVFFENKNGELSYLNLECAKSLTFNSVKKSIGKNIFDILNYSDALKTRKNDLLVMDNHCQQLFDEDGVRSKDNLFINFLSLKMPWYDLENNLLGLFGFGIMLGTNSMARGLQNILATNLFIPHLHKQSSHLPANKDFIYLSHREKEILIHTVRGMTARKVANLLDISMRTVEHHLEWIKQKFGVTSKSDLIAKVIEFYPAYLES